MDRGLARQDARILNLEEGQAFMSGQFPELKNYFTHHPESVSDSQSGDWC